MDYHDPMEPFKVPPELNRRVAAAGIDITLAVLLTLPSLLSAFPIGFTLSERSKWGLILLAVWAAVELFTGQTIGKLLAGLRMRREDGSAMLIGQALLRGVVRLLPVTVLLLCLVPGEELTRMIVLFAAITLGLCWFPACYFSLFRRGRTTFDLIAGTKAVVAKPARAAKNEATGT